MIPGINLFAIASNVIATDTVLWAKFVSRELNELGNWINTYESPEEIRCSVQPVEAREYQTLGLDLSKRYITIFTSHDVQHVKREAGPDRFIWNSAMWESVGGDDWFNQDGWRESLLVYIGEPIDE